MDSLILFPLTVMRRRIWMVLIPSAPILFLIAFLILTGSRSPDDLLSNTDLYLGGTLYMSAANMTAFNDLSANILIPLIRLGGIADRGSISGLLSASPPSIMVFLVLFLGFMSYSVISRGIHSLLLGGKAKALGGINPATLILSIVASLLMIFISSFSLAGFKLILMLNFGVFFTFSIPYAAIGEPLGESVFKGFRFISKHLGLVVLVYIGSMGAAIMIPVALLLLTTPLLFNLSSHTATVLLLLFLSLLSLILSLFYQMVLCSAATLKNFGDGP